MINAMEQQLMHDATVRINVLTDENKQLRDYIKQLEHALLVFRSEQGNFSLDNI